MCIRDSFYAGGLGETWAQDRGLCRSEFADAKTATGRKRQPKPGDAQLVKIPPTAADDLLALLKRMAEGKEAVSYTHLDVYKRQG